MRAVRSGATAGAIGAVGDWLMQWREGVRTLDNVDLRRTSRLMAYRALHAPCVEAGWGFFDRRLSAFSGPSGVVARVLCDQIILAPPSIVVFFLSQGAMEGHQFATCLARTRDSFWPTYGVCFPYWCCCHVLTFSIIPPHLRIAYASCCGVLWNAIISGHNQQAVRRESEAGTAAL